MSSDSIDLSKKIAIAAYKKYSIEKIGYVEYIENRGVAISPNLGKAKAFSEPETRKMLQICRTACPDYDFLEFRIE